MLIPGIFLTLIWVILSENTDPLSIAAGVVVSFVAVHLSARFLPVPKISGISLFRLALYPFFIIWQIYLAGLNAMGLVIKGSVVNIVRIKTELTNDFTKTLLANSITLTPGTITIDLNQDELTVLWLRETPLSREELLKPDELGEEIKGTMERELHKLQR